MLVYFRVMFYGMGGVLVVLALRNAWRGFASRSWPQAPGRITRSFVLVDHDVDGSSAFTPQVEFEYRVGETGYRGKVLRYGRIGAWSRRHAEGVIAPYPEGASVKVFYDPRKPASAVLLPGTSWGNLGIAAAGLVFLATAALLSLRHG